MKTLNDRRLKLYKQILAKQPMYSEALSQYEELYKDTGVSQLYYLHCVAPVLIEFTAWTLQRAAESGKKRLYFLARDGWQMYIAAKELVKAMGLDIDCRYLRVSRYAIRVPEYHLLGEKCLERICIGGIDVTFEKIMKRAALTDAQAMEIAMLCGWQSRYKNVLNYQEVMALKSELYSQKKLFEYIYEHSRKAFPSAIGYFKQEGLLDDVPYAFVDSGWTGTQQQSIKNLLSVIKPDITAEGYYFGLYETPDNAEENGLFYNGFYFMPKNGIKRKVYFSNSLFEAVTSSPEGMTLGYSQEGRTLQEEGKHPQEDCRHSWDSVKDPQNGGRYVCVFDMSENVNALRTEADCEALKKYLPLLCNICNNNKMRSEQFGKSLFYKNKKDERRRIKILYRLMSLWMGNPENEEVAAFGGFMFSDDMLEGALQRVSKDLSEEDIKNQRFIRKLLIMLGFKKEVIHESAWIEGSIAAGTKNRSANLRHARFYKYFVYVRKALK